MYGIDRSGDLYVHVKIYKQSRVYGEILVTGGKVRLHCRECLRWHVIRIVQPNKPVLEETSVDIEPRVPVPVPMLDANPTPDVR